METVSRLQNSDQVPIKIERVFKEVREMVPKDGIIVSDVGGCKYGVAQIPFYGPGTNIPSSGFATMGFAPAAAIGAKIGRPEKNVVAIVGDGAFSSVSSVLATAVEQGVNVVWVVINNYGYCSNTEIIVELFKTAYGTEHRIKRTGEPYNPDFAKMAESYSAKGECIKKPEEIRGALERAFKSGSPYVLDVIVGFEGSFSQNQGNVTEILTKK